MYRYIFFTNVLRMLELRQMTKQELKDRSGVSSSFISDITNGKGNPSLDTMEQIAAALECPLPLLLDWTDLNKEELDQLAGGAARQTLPDGYEWIAGVLPEHRAYQVKLWTEEARKKLKSL